jgi:hypothetical protein
VVDRPVVLRLPDAGNLGPVPAHLVDVSASGIGVRLKRPLAPGKQFTLDVGTQAKAGEAVVADKAAVAAAACPSGSAGGAFVLWYRVIWCKPLGQGAFHIGAAFVRAPVSAPVKAAGPAAAAPKRA